MGAHPVTKSVDAVRVVVQPLGGRRCVRSRLRSKCTNFVDEEFKTGLDRSGFFESTRGGVPEDVVAQTVGVERALYEGKLVWVSAVRCSMR